jgi:hypothetical protein
MPSRMKTAQSTSMNCTAMNRSHRGMRGLARLRAKLAA